MHNFEELRTEATTAGWKGEKLENRKVCEGHH